MRSRQVGGQPSNFSPHAPDGSASFTPDTRGASDIFIAKRRYLVYYLGVSTLSRNLKEVNMYRVLRLSAVLFLAAACASPVLGQSRERGHRDHVKYEKRYRDPALKSIGHEADSLKAVSDSITAAIQKEHRDAKKKKSDERKVISFDWSGIAKPESPDVFDAPFHYPPIRQYRTGTCWCFSTTSFFESEVKRLTGQEIKLSEMYTVYWEYVEKALGYIEKRGCQPFSAGSEDDAVSIIWRKYGVVPASAYSGLPPGKDMYDDVEMDDEMADYLKFAKDNDYWDKDVIISQIRAILDKYMGPPPGEFEYEGKRYTPKQFLDEVLKLNLDDYVQFMSTLSLPFYTKGLYDVPDNWRPTSDYYNVPLDEFYEIITRATARKYTVAIGGDVSEPGRYGFEDGAIVPTFDIPQDYIDQDSREFRIDNKTSQDDHGIHLLAMKKVGGHDWFLIKDSSSSATWGKYNGYYFFRDDYIKLKMLSFMVHKDIAQYLMPKFKAE
jgi:bleomycin hydrolase